MKFDEIKENEDKRQMEKKTQKQIEALLIQEDRLWEKIKPAFAKYMDSLIEEFANLFKEQGFKQNSMQSNKAMCTMTYGERWIVFDVLNEFEFKITDRTKDSANPFYQFTIQMKNLGLERNFKSVLINNKAEFLPQDLQKETLSIANYIAQLEVALKRDDLWEFEILPFDDTAYRFEEKQFSCISEIIQSIN